MVSEVTEEMLLVSAVPSSAAALAARSGKSSSVQLAASGVVSALGVGGRSEKLRAGGGSTKDDDNAALSPSTFFRGEVSGSRIPDPMVPLFTEETSGVDEGENAARAAWASFSSMICEAPFTT